tara:strand:- start:244 stop:612 length:369 start_codon:yes stop_codon:yes gene_type:complete
MADEKLPYNATPEQHAAYVEKYPHRRPLVRGRQSKPLEALGIKRGGPIDPAAPIKYISEQMNPHARARMEAILKAMRFQETPFVPMPGKVMVEAYQEHLEEEEAKKPKKVVGAGRLAVPEEM